MSDQLAQQFVETYYTTFQKNKNDLLQFYTEDSIMSFEGNHNKGIKEISDRIEQLSFESIKHEIISLDAHPSVIQGAILITVTGNMQTDNDPALKFVQVFHLVPNGSGGYFCANDIFRLIMNDFPK